MWLYISESSTVEQSYPMASKGYNAKINLFPHGEGPPESMDTVAFLRKIGVTKESKLKAPDHISFLGCDYIRADIVACMVDRHEA